MADRPRTVLGGLTARAFLERHWQKRPLVVRGAFPGFDSPVTPSELAGWACESGVESRLVLETGGKRPWEVRHGPFTPATFASLADRGWTLLVHEMDRHVAAVADVLARFRFVPNWRMDDVMISYAPAGGGVGPHVDRYDVFLLQASGRRRWGLGGAPVEQPVTLPDVDAEVLADFRPAETTVLEPGDLLYLPPRFAHHGVAVDECTTWSIGFRAPGHAELAGACLAHLAESCDRDRTYADPDLTVQDNPGRIEPAALARVRKILRGMLDEGTAAGRWFGAWVTAPRREQQEEPLDTPLSPEEVARQVREGAVLRRSAPSRFAYLEDGARSTTLFVGGDAWRLDPDLAFAAPLLCGEARLDRVTLDGPLALPAFAALVTEVVNRGFLIVETPAQSTRE